MNDDIEKNKNTNFLIDELERYKNIFENAPIGLIVIDSGGYILNLNSKYQKLLGYSKEYIIGKHVTNFCTDECKSTFNERFLELMKTGSIETKLELINKEGKIIPITKKAVAKYDKNQNFIGAQLYVEDISDFVDTQRNFQELELKYQILFNNALDGILLLKGEKIISCNNVIVELLQIPEDEIIGRSPAEFPPLIQSDGVNSRVKLLDFFKKAKIEPQFFEWDLELYNKKRLTLEVSLNSIKQNESDYYLAILRDITSRREAEKKILESKVLYKKIAEQALMGIVIVQDFKIRYANSTFSKITGYEFEDTLNWTIDDLFKLLVKEKRSIAKKLGTEVLKKRKDALGAEYKIRTKLGKFKWVKTSTKSIKYEGKNALIVSFIDITSEKNSRLKLLESEKKYREIIETSSIGLLEINLNNGSRTYVNPKFLEMVGYEAHELNSMESMRKIIHPEDYKKLLQDHKQKYLEFRVITKKGETRWLAGERINYYENGRISFLRLWLINITKRKKLEQALMQSEELFRTISNSAGYAIILLDNEGLVSYWNPEAENIFEYSKEEILGKELHTMIAPSSVYEIYKQGFKQFRITGKGPVLGKKLELTAIRKNGEEFPIELRISPINIKNEWNAIGILQDITERKKFERALRNSEAKYQDLYENAPIAYFSIDIEGNIIKANKEAEKFTGYKISKLKKMKIFDLHVNEAKKKAKILFQKIREGIDFDNEEMIYLRKDGKKVYGLLSVNSIKDEKEGVIETRLVIIDINERKRMEQELKLKIKELDEFAYIVSHDLKAPLRGISSLAEWLKEDYQDKIDEEGNELINTMQSRVKRLSNLIDGILQYSRIGRKNIEKAKINAHQIVEDVIRSMYIPKNFEVRINGILPMIYYNEFQFQQIIQNLISNALKYMGKPSGTVTISCEEIPNFWKFCVRDTGQGIEKKHYERIFKIFQTLQPRDEIESTGIGLSIVKKVVELNGGKVWVESELGKGSSFYFTIERILFLNKSEK
ncbi:MAG: PAS domain-containing sensor histidine kinase [Candidatus Helarchaeota archaeon]